MESLRDALGFCEQSFLLTPEQAGALLPLLEERLRPDGEGERVLRDLYYDTRTWAFARAAFGERPYQECLWLRGEEAQLGQGRAMVMLRQTLNGRIWQKSAGAGLSMLEQRLSGEMPPAGDGLFWQQLYWLVRRTRPAPRALVRYERAGYAGREDPTLRVLLDRGARWRGEQLSLAAGPGGAPLFCGDRAVLTVQSGSAVPFWLTSALSGLSVYAGGASRLTACWRACVGPGSLPGSAAPQA